MSIYIGDPPSTLGGSSSDEAVFVLVSVIKYNDLLDVISLSDGEPIAFTLYRGKDSSGVSGTGKVLEGVIFSDRTVAAHWCTDNAPVSTTVYDNADGTTGWWKFVNIHVQPHPFNETRIEFKKATTKNGIFDAYWEQKADPAAVIQKDVDDHFGHLVADPDCSFCKNAGARPTPPPATPTPPNPPFGPVPSPGLQWYQCAVCQQWVSNVMQHVCRGTIPGLTPYPFNNPPYIYCGGHTCEPPTTCLNCMVIGDTHFE